MLAVLVLMTILAPGAAYSQQSPRGKQNFGALAYHQDSGSFGYAVDTPSARAARIEALRLCGHPNCEVVLGLHNGCGAVASRAGRFAAARGTTRQEAQTKAARKCGSRCEIAGWACTR